MKSFLLSCLLNVILRIFLFFSSLCFNLFFRNLNILNCNSFIHNFIVFDARVCLFVEPFVILADSLVLFSFVSIQDVFGKVAVVGNSSNLIAVDVFSYQLLSVFNGSLFASVDRAGRSPGDALPKSNVHVFRACILP